MIHHASSLGPLLKPQREFLNKYVRVGKFPGKGSRNSPNTVNAPSAPTPRQREEMYLLPRDTWVCQVAFYLVHWDFYPPRNPHEVAKVTGVKSKGWMPRTETYPGVSREDRYNISSSSAEDSVQDKERKRKIRQEHEQFPCTLTWAALDADQQRWGEVMPCFLRGWESLNRAWTHTQRERRKLQALMEFHSSENRELV